MIPISISQSTISNPDVPFGVSKLSELLQAFAVLAPPERVIHIGTGSSQSETLCWRDWSLTEAIVIDAEEQNFEHIDTGLNPNTKLYKHSAVLAESIGPADYFVANNLSENGLIDPTLLRMVWPSLALSHRAKKDALTLDSLVVDKPLQSWLLIDCLPAVRILTGATETLKDTTLVCVRSLAEPGFRGEPVGADIKSIDSWLDVQGFKRLAFVSGLNPKIGHAIYGRPAVKPLPPQDLPFVKALNQELLAKVVEITKLNEDLGNITAHRDTLAAQLQGSAEKFQAIEECSRQANEQLQALTAELDQERIRSGQLQATLAERDAALQAKAGELDSNAAQIAKLNEDLGHTAAHRDTLAAQLQTTAESLQASEEHSRQAAEQLQARSTELDQERARSGQLQAALAERDAALQAKAGELEAKAAQIAKLNEDLGHTAAHRDTLAAQLQSSTESLQASEERSRQAAEQLQARSAELDQERARSGQLQATLAERDAALQVKAGELESKAAQMGKLNEDLGNTSAYRDTLAAQLQTSAENLQASEERSRQAAEQLQARSAELEANAAQLTKLNEQLGHLSVERDSLVERFKSAQQNLQNSEQTLASLKSELETEVSRRERITAENQELIHRQQLMNEELVKAEGQISLIKDLLLREQGL